MPSNTASSSTCSSSKQSAQVDPATKWYGHQAIATTTARYISHLFSCPDLPPYPSASGARSPLANFVAYSLYRTQLPPSVATIALLFLYRLKKRYPSARGSSGQRLWLSSYMLAAKMVCDDTYSNQSWCIVGQEMFPLKEVNQMEREMLGYLEWDIGCTPQQVIDLDHLLNAKFSSHEVKQSESSTSSPSTDFRGQTSASSAYNHHHHAIPSSSSSSQYSQYTPASVPMVHSSMYAQSYPSTAVTMYPSPPSSPDQEYSRSASSTPSSATSSHYGSCRTPPLRNNAYESVPITVAADSKTMYSLTAPSDGVYVV
ncbi:Cyclin [Phaffia rhodozyma]|uniref:Cyclin n=1 Tax=Phaffia rhodozyma TaxID=264483 RepID=A0A0F7SK98_PHARH|nr:Cyclin [Phaffia rhodozyma]